MEMTGKMPSLAAADTLIMCQRTLRSALGAVEWMIPAGHGYALWQVAAEENGPEGTEDCLGHSLGHTHLERSGQVGSVCTGEFPVFVPLFWVRVASQDLQPSLVTTY